MSLTDDPKGWARAQVERLRADPKAWALEQGERARKLVDVAPFSDEALDRELLARVEARAPDEVLADGALADALPVIEGLSHLLYLAEAARRERRISGLELETQAEVDKLALCLFDRRGHAPARYDALVDRLFYRFTLADDLTPELRDRYETANRLALAFARRLDRDVREGRWSRLRRTLQVFWGGTFEAKLGLAR
ncbi:MAG: hypothetical protein KC420_06660 [Myxococcales bacterium]|nr:hypothetical protein [Myxococcales bacterium]